MANRVQEILPNRCACFASVKSRPLVHWLVDRPKRHFSDRTFLLVTLPLQCDPAGCLVELSIQFVISKNSREENFHRLCSVMIGKQLINNVFEFIVAMSRSVLRCWSSDQQKTESQWEIDNQLFVFDSNTLIDEYLELGEKIFRCRVVDWFDVPSSHSIRFYYALRHGISVGSRRNVVGRSSTSLV